MESIHPNDIITMDLGEISYLTLKNGNMILIDDSVPEKGNKENKNIPKSSIFSKNETKIAPKKFKLEITYPSKLFVKGIKVNNIKDKYNNKPDYKRITKIIKNESFTFKGIKQNNYYNNMKEKENIQMNNNFEIEKNHKVCFKDDFNNNKINNEFSPTSSKENEIPQMKAMSYNNTHVNQNNNFNNIINNFNQANQYMEPNYLYQIALGPLYSLYLNSQQTSNNNNNPWEQYSQNNNYYHNQNYYNYGQKQTNKYNYYNYGQQQISQNDYYDFQNNYNGYGQLENINSINVENKENAKI